MHRNLLVVGMSLSVSAAIVQRGAGVIVTTGASAVTSVDAKFAQAAQNAVNYAGNCLTVTGTSPTPAASAFFLRELGYRLIPSQAATCGNIYTYMTAQLYVAAPMVTLVSMNTQTSARLLNVSTDLIVVKDVEWTTATISANTLTVDDRLRAVLGNGRTGTIAEQVYRQGPGLTNLYANCGKEQGGYSAHWRFGSPADLSLVPSFVFSGPACDGFAARDSYLPMKVIFYPGGGNIDMSYTAVDKPVTIASDKYWSSSYTADKSLEVSWMPSMIATVRMQLNSSYAEVLLEDLVGTPAAFRLEANTGKANISMISSGVPAQEKLTIPVLAIADSAEVEITGLPSLTVTVDAVSIATDGAARTLKPSSESRSLLPSQQRRFCLQPTDWCNPISWVDLELFGRYPEQSCVPQDDTLQAHCMDGERLHIETTTRAITCSEEIGSQFWKLGMYTKPEDSPVSGLPTQPGYAQGSLIAFLVVAFLLTSLVWWAHSSIWGPALWDVTWLGLIITACLDNLNPNPWTWNLDALKLLRMVNHVMVNWTVPWICGDDKMDTLVAGLVIAVSLVLIFCAIVLINRECRRQRLLCCKDELHRATEETEAVLQGVPESYKPMATSASFTNPVAGVMELSASQALRPQFTRGPGRFSVMAASCVLILMVLTPPLIAREVLGKSLHVFALVLMAIAFALIFFDAILAMRLVGTRITRAAYVISVLIQIGVIIAACILGREGLALSQDKTDSLATGCMALVVLHSLSCAFGQPVWFVASQLKQKPRWALRLVYFMILIVEAVCGILFVYNIHHKPETTTTTFEGLWIMWAVIGPLLRSLMALMQYRSGFIDSEKQFESSNSSSNSNTSSGGGQNQNKSQGQGQNRGGDQQPLMDGSGQADDSDGGYVPPTLNQAQGHGAGNEEWKYAGTSSELATMTFPRAGSAVQGQETQIDFTLATSHSQYFGQPAQQATGSGQSQANPVPPTTSAGRQQAGPSSRATGSDIGYLAVAQEDDGSHAENSNSNNGGYKQPAIPIPFAGQGRPAAYSESVAASPKSNSNTNSLGLMPRSQSELGAPNPNHTGRRSTTHEPTSRSIPHADQINRQHPQQSVYVSPEEQNAPSQVLKTRAVMDRKDKDQEHSVNRQVAIDTARSPAGRGYVPKSP